MMNCWPTVGLDILGVTGRRKGCEPLGCDIQSLWLPFGFHSVQSTQSKSLCELYAFCKILYICASVLIISHIVILDVDFFFIWNALVWILYIINLVSISREISAWCHHRKESIFWRFARSINHYIFSMCLNQARSRSRLQFLCTVRVCVCALCINSTCGNTYHGLFIWGISLVALCITLWLMGF